MDTDGVDTGARQDDMPNKGGGRMRDTFSLRNVRRSVIRWWLAPRNRVTVPHTVACQKALDALVSCPPPERLPPGPLAFRYDHRRGQWVALSTREQIVWSWGIPLFLVSLTILLRMGVWLAHAF